MTPEKPPQNSAEQREDCPAARTDSTSKDRRALKIRKRIITVKGTMACYLALLQLLGEILIDDIS